MSLLDIPIARLDGTDATLGQITGGGPALLVNVASKCGLTPQYTALEALHEQYAGRGFTVVGVPCNQFGGQDQAGHAGDITWNFEKFLVDGSGAVVARFAPTVVPDDPRVTGAIESLL